MNVLVGFSQDNGNRAPKRLVTGDTIPEVFLSHIYNYKETSVNLSTFKRKLLILDFWATWCGSCVKTLPKLDSLQKAFGDEIAILPVTAEDLAHVTAFLKKSNVLQKIKLPFVVEDTVLKELFRYRLLPHEVWIDGNGIIQAITSSEYITRENITKAINANFDLPLKEDNLTLDLQLPLFVNGDANDDANFVYRSMFTKYMSGYATGFHVDTDKRYKLGHWNSIKRFLAVNATPLQLFHASVGHPSINFKRMIVDVKDSSEYFAPIDSVARRQWLQRYTVCYELIMPEFVPYDKIRQVLFGELNRSLPLKGRIEQHIVDCWILTRTDRKNNWMKSRGGEPGYVGGGGILRRLNNVPVDELIYFLSRYNNMEPILDETGYTDSIDIELNLSYSNGTEFFQSLDHRQLEKALSKSGLRLVKRKRQAPILYLTDKPEIYKKWFK